MPLSDIDDLSCANAFVDGALASKADACIYISMVAARLARMYLYPF